MLLPYVQKPELCFCHFEKFAFKSVTALYCLNYIMDSGIVFNASYIHSRNMYVVVHVLIERA